MPDRNPMEGHNPHPLPGEKEGFRPQMTMVLCLFKYIPTADRRESLYD